jgi:hypothetical protein
MEITKPGSHIDYMLQQTRNHHVQLSSMADMKANILLTLSAVVLTLSVRYLMDPHLRWAALALIVFCLLTILLATYAVMPKLPLSLGRRSHPSVDTPGFDLLFFGDFTRLSYEEFEAAMETVINDPGRTYQVQVLELYTLGTFLVKVKYRFLQWAYITFLAGILAAGLVLIILGLLG